MTIIRTKTKASGGITEHEKRLMEEHAKLWIARAMRTDPIEPGKIIPAIEGLYAAASLKKPRVVIVSSPLVMAYAYGAAAAIWYERKRLKIGERRSEQVKDETISRAIRDTPVGAAYEATNDAIREATRCATYDVRDACYDNDTTYGASFGDLPPPFDVTFDVIRDATDDIQKSAAGACIELAGEFGIECAKRCFSNCENGNMEVVEDCYFTACRDILSLDFPEFAAYAHWEQAAIHGGFRVMHEEFCMVCDFAEIIRTDSRNRPHCETGPSVCWRDGWSLYHWHGTRIPAAWIEDRKSLTPTVALGQENL